MDLPQSANRDMSAQRPPVGRALEQDGPEIGGATSPQRGEVEVPSVVRILFVDDEELILKALRRSLQREGYELFFSPRPAEAIELVGAHKVDIVVSDYMMPGMNGVEVLARLRELHPSVVRIMMTGQADRDATLRAIREGNIHRYIEKPWDDAALKSILKDTARDILEKRQPEA